MKKILNRTTKMLALSLAVSFFGASIANAKTDMIEINFSEHLEKRMDQISSIDKKREKLFRKYRTDGSRSSLRTRASTNRARFKNTEWANERLIPDLDDYSVPKLITAMMERGIEGANPDGFDGRVVVDIDKMFVASFPLVSINSFNSRMEGTVKVYDNAGNLVTERDIQTQLLPDFTATRSYDGPDYAYLSTAGSTRVGPIAAEFSADVLEIAFPGYEAPSLVFLTPSPISGGF